MLKKILALTFFLVLIVSNCHAKPLTNIKYDDFPYLVESHLNNKIEQFELYEQSNSFDIYKITFNELNNDSRMYVVLKDNEFVQVMFINVTDKAKQSTYNKIMASLIVFGFSDKQAKHMLEEVSKTGNYYMWSEQELFYISLVKKEITNGDVFYIVRT